MKYLFNLLLLICIGISACNDKQKINEKNIAGTWIKIKTNHSPFHFGKTDLSFYADQTFDNKQGYFKRNDSDSYFLGTRSTFKITGDSLMMFDLDNRNWDKYRIVILSANSLELNQNGEITTFKRYQVKETKTPEFDQIILSTSGCFGTCPVSSTMINADGSVSFNGLLYTTKKGLFTGSITKLQYKQLQDNFRNTDFSLLKNSYNVGWSDAETISTTFVKNGKIYKSVNDYGSAAPAQFTWAYSPLRYLYQSITLKSVTNPKPVSSLNYPNRAHLKTANMAMDLTQAETFLLFYYLQKGKVSNAAFKARYQLSSYFDVQKFHDIDTDGRFYKLEVNKKPIIIDIGFNFYDVNASNWQWRKINEYD